MNKLSDKINSQLFSYAKKVAFAPHSIRGVNLPEVILQELKHWFQQATVQAIQTGEFNTLNSQTLDLLLGNFVAANVELDNFFKEAARVLSRKGLLIFAALDHDKIVSLLENIPNLHYAFVVKGSGNMSYEIFFASSFQTPLYLKKLIQLADTASEPVLPANLLTTEEHNEKAEKPEADEDEAEGEGEEETEVAEKPEAQEAEEHPEPEEKSEPAEVEEHAETPEAVEMESREDTTEVEAPEWEAAEVAEVREPAEAETAEPAEPDEQEPPEALETEEEPAETDEGEENEPSEAQEVNEAPETSHEHPEHQAHETHSEHVTHEKIETLAEGLAEHQEVLAEHAHILSEHLESTAPILHELRNKNLNSQDKQTKMNQLKDAFFVHKNLLTQYKTELAQHQKLLSNFLNAQQKTLDHAAVADQYHELVQHHAELLADHEEIVQEHTEFQLKL